MTICGTIRCKNGARWIEECVTALLKVCDKVFILDNQSTDNTVDILSRIQGTIVVPSPFGFINEARDKTFITAKAVDQLAADWIVGMDSDEVLLDPEALLENINSGTATAYKLSYVFLWDSPNQIRVDGIYADFWRSSVFSTKATNGVWEQDGTEGPNLHSNWVPTDMQNKAVQTDPKVRIKHYGPMLREDRIAKYNFYRTIDPDNEGEDNYRHSVLGDLPEFPATASYRHGGPLTLVPWDEKCD